MQSIEIDGQKIRKLREDAGVTVSELAFEMRVSQSAMSYIELGAKIPGVDLLFRIADYFGVDINDFIIRKSA